MLKKGFLIPFLLIFIGGKHQTPQITTKKQLMLNMLIMSINRWETLEKFQENYVEHHLHVFFINTISQKKLFSSSRNLVLVLIIYLFFGILFT